MKPDRVSLSKEQIAEFCQRNHIKRFAYFGSVLKDDFRSDSDIDILIDDQDPAKIREILLNYLPENLSKEDESISDTLGRVFKI